jgi:hypothetical protein
LLNFNVVSFYQYFLSVVYAVFVLLYFCLNKSFPEHQLLGGRSSTIRSLRLVWAI